jgi:hypothetical protein
MTRRTELAGCAALLLLFSGAAWAETCTISDKGDCGVGSESVICDAKGGCESDCSCYLFGPDEPFAVLPASECSSLSVGGWVQAGYHSLNIPLSAARGDGLAFNDVPDDFNVHQLWLYAERR